MARASAPPGLGPRAAARAALTLAVLTLAALTGAASPAWAEKPEGEGDISETIRYITAAGTFFDFDEDMMALVEANPSEALSLLLGRGGIDAGSHTLATLGGVRLDLAELKPHIEAAARATGLPAALIDAVIRTESGYRPRAVSRAGASGLMQLMPGTAREVGVRDVFDPRQNIMGGARYLRKLVDRFNSTRLAVAAYNAGPGAVDRHGGVPPFAETRAYVRTVMARYQKSRLGGIAGE
jgi:soluble lytic murein transglycosylase-like protein